MLAPNSWMAGIRSVNSISCVSLLLHKYIVPLLPKLYCYQLDFYAIMPDLVADKMELYWSIDAHICEDII